MASTLCFGMRVDPRRFSPAFLYPKKKARDKLALFPLERVRGIEPLSSVWKTEIITIIRYPQSFFVKPFPDLAKAGREPGTRTRNLSLPKRAL